MLSMFCLCCMLQCSWMLPAQRKRWSGWK